MAVATAPAPSPSVEAPVSPGWRRWLAVGTGVGIEVGAQDLRAAIVKLRPSGVDVLDTIVIAGYAERPATEWGTVYAEFLRRNRMKRRPAVVLLPRGEVIVRHLELPGVADNDLESAIGFQIESLHPYAEEEAAWCWGRLPGSAHVVVGITRRDLIERFWTLFVEAGVSVSSFTFSSAALYASARLISAPPRQFLTIHNSGDALEAYGESPARPLFSGSFEGAGASLVPRLLSELRLEPETEPLPVDRFIPAPRRAPAGFELDCWLAPTAAAMSAASPVLALRANLLPPERRAQTSRLIFIPSIVLAVLLLIAAVMVSMQRSWEDKRYLAKLQGEIQTLERQASRATILDREAAAVQARMELLDRFRKRTKADIDALKEITALLPAPGWAQGLQLSRTDLMINGEAEGAASLIQVIDGSPLFRNAQFSQPMARIGLSAESFIIRAQREGEGTGLEPGGEQ